MKQEENQAMNSEQTRSRRYLLVGSGLLAAVVIVLVGAWLLDDRFRPAADVRRNQTSPEAISLVTTATALSVSTTTASPTSERGAVASPTNMIDVEQAVEQAYLRYWDIYGDALYTLDTSHLDEVMAGTELQLALERIEGLRSSNQAATIDVEHNHVIVDISSTTAAIEDRYLNKSYLVDATSKQPLQSPDEGEIESIACRLELRDGIWKVVEVVRVDR
jgi:hypothetical protein